ncbi:MAG TPA: GNAT family acetyltransferase [Dongiaceae bacterium]|jgi:GNAT superfamily N-acetyltransferase|nr:GNAT family acetyltransferase [Dongiaceae bacterium]
MTLTLRGYRDEDFAAVVDLWTACHLLKPHHDPKREVAFVHGATNAELFLAFEGERLAGSIQVGHDAHRAWMYRLGVAEDLRRRGIGRALVARAESWALARGLPKLMLLIRDGNEAVAEVYRRLGYVQEPRLVMSKSFKPQDRPGPDAMIDVVITYLEMTAVPTRPTVPAPADIRLALLRAEAPGTAFYRFLYEQVGDPWFWYERKHLSDAELAKIIGDPAVEIYVPYVTGVPAGYVEIDRRSGSEVKFAYFGLIPAYIGRGLGWYFLNWAIDTAWTGGTERLVVDTCTLDHPKALQTYQRAGFTPFRQEHRQIVDPRFTGKTPKHLEPRLP